MTYFYDEPNRIYKSLNKQFTINQEIKRESDNNQRKTRFSITSASELNVVTDWMPVPDWKGFIDLLISKAPMIKDNFPIIEISEIKLGRQLLCSAYLLQDGTLVKQYMPKNDTLNRLEMSLKRHDRMQLSTGEKILDVKATDIVALVNE